MAFVGEKTAKTHLTSFFSLVNALALALTSMIALMAKAIEQSEFEVASAYLNYLWPVMILYIVLRLPDILSATLVV